MKKQQARLRQYAGQVADYEQEIERLKAQLDKLISCGGCCSGRVQRKAAINWKIKSARQRSGWLSWKTVLDRKSVV